MRGTSSAARYVMGALALTSAAGAQELDEARFTRCVMTRYQAAQGLPAGKLTRDAVQQLTASASLPLVEDLVLTAPPGFELSHVGSDSVIQVDKALSQQTVEGRVVRVVLPKDGGWVPKGAAAPKNIRLTAVVSRIVPEQQAQAIVRSCLDEHQTKSR